MSKPLKIAEQPVGLLIRNIDVLRREICNPRWEERRHKHDWRNHISGGVKEIWDTFTYPQRLALYEQAQKQADNEEWD